MRFLEQKRKDYHVILPIRAFLVQSQAFVLMSDMLDISTYHCIVEYRYSTPSSTATLEIDIIYKNSRVSNYHRNLPITVLTYSKRLAVAIVQFYASLFRSCSIAAKKSLE